MRRISIIFLAILFFQVISIEYKQGFDIYYEDVNKCYNAKGSSISTDCK